MSLDHHRTSPATFELDVFAWDAPDRLRLSGSFSGLAEPLPQPPVLTLLSPNGSQRLPAVPGSLSGPAQDGRRWHAAFAWRQAPQAFEAAQLELGSAIVQLPKPHPTGATFPERVLVVRAADDPMEEPVDDDLVSGEPPGGGADRLRLQTELLGAQAAIRELHADLRRTQDELARAREDLGSDRARHDEDVERFRQGLEAMRSSAEEAVAGERAVAERLTIELQDARVAIDEREVALAAAVAERERIEVNAETAIEDLRDRISVLEEAAMDAAALRAEAAAARERADAVEERLEQAGRIMGEGRPDVERMLERMLTVDRLLQREP